MLAIKRFGKLFDVWILGEKCIRTSLYCFLFEPSDLVVVVCFKQVDQDGYFAAEEMVPQLVAERKTLIFCITAVNHKDVWEFLVKLIQCQHAVPNRWVGTPVRFATVNGVQVGLNSCFECCAGADDCDVGGVFRQADVESCTFARLATDAQFSSVSFDNFIGTGQPKAKPCFASTALQGGLGGLEYLRDKVGANAWAGINNADFFVLVSQRNPVASLAEFERIGEQVVKNSANKYAVTVNARFCRCAVLYADSLELTDFADFFDHFVGKVFQVELFADEFKRASGEFFRVQNVVDHFEHAIYRTLNLAECGQRFVGVQLIMVFLESADRHDDAGQRGPQIMRKHGDDLVTESCRFFESFQMAHDVWIF